MRTEASRLFDELNRKYWRGRLPRYRVIRKANLPGNCFGLCSDRTKTILLKRDLRGEALRLTLLHEMCHIGPSRGYSHGPIFLRKLHRLRRLGEPALLGDIEAYDGTETARMIETLQAQGKVGPEIPFRAAVESDLEAYSFSPFSNRRWPTIRRAIAGSYRLSPAQFQRLAPWAEREWQRLRREARYEERVEKALKEGKRPPRFRD